MIAYLEGRVLYLGSDHIVLVVQGIGYQVYVPSRILLTLQVEEQAELHIYQVIREDQMTLYGFSSRDERELFSRVLGVTGIGPKIALAVISSTDIGLLAQQIVSEDLDSLQKIPGIGKKTAQRMMIELKDKVSEFVTMSQWQSFAEAAPAKAPVRSLTADLLDTLVGLGYGERESRAVIRSLSREMEEGMPLEELIRTALRQLTNI